MNMAAAVAKLLYGVGTTYERERNGRTLGTVLNGMRERASVQRVQISL